MGFLVMELIEINDQTYAYKIHQRDDNLPYLLMQHGFMGDHRVFEHLVETLCTFCNPIAIDLLGYGKSSKPTDPQRYHETKQIEDILSIIKNLKLDRLFLYGYSMGGRLAMQIAIANPSYFTGLILESATCGIAEKNSRQGRRQQDEARAKQIESDFDKFLTTWEMLDLFKSPLTTDEKLTQKYHLIQSQQSPSALAASLRGFGTGSMSPVCNNLHKIVLPTLLIAGSNDEKYQRINNDLVNQFPNAIFKSVKAGHRVHLDNPPALVSEIKQYLNKII